MNGLRRRFRGPLRGRLRVTADNQALSLRGAKADEAIQNGISDWILLRFARNDEGGTATARLSAEPFTQALRPEISATRHLRASYRATM